MHIYDLVELYEQFIKGSAKSSLDVIDLAEKEGVKDMIDLLISQGCTKTQIAALATKKSKGRKFEVIKNPIAVKLNETEEGGFNIDDAISGICNSFEKGEDAKRVRISPRKLKLVLKMDEITTDNAKGILFVGTVQARRYIKAAKLIITVFSKES